ncbi:PREDICTED: uncharacterized protein LOC106148199 [Chinchilla lanigera]|uniref:uncharacterized protein LOC106148199 n=1 Tax=Chinchilla lanigera TaxID=34839 RepID=UPI00069678B0|nr:PREDICTED: uncharacterized protein LOC106148199 [Chinchilla lanigera]
MRNMLCHVSQACSMSACCLRDAVSEVEQEQEKSKRGELRSAESEDLRQLLEGAREVGVTAHPDCSLSIFILTLWALSVHRHLSAFETGSREDLIRCREHTTRPSSLFSWQRRSRRQDHSYCWLCPSSRSQDLSAHTRLVPPGLHLRKLSYSSQGIEKSCSASNTPQQRKQRAEEVQSWTSLLLCAGYKRPGNHERIRATLMKRGAITIKARRRGVAQPDCYRSAVTLSRK